jgi:DNA-binding CsgD family transcriptional regulator
MNILRNITLSNSDIAIVLGISEGTVRNTLSTIYQKITLTTRPDLARYVQDILLLAPSQNVS